MKLRIRGNSIRLRLTKSEIAQLADTGRVEEMLDFGFKKPVLRYQLHATYDAETIQAMFQDNCLHVFVPKRDAEFQA